MRKRCGDITSVCLDVLQRVSKSTICSRILGCAKRALFSSSGAISCSYPSFGVSVQTFFIYLFFAQHMACAFLYIFNKIFMSTCH